MNIPQALRVEKTTRQRVGVQLPAFGDFDVIEFNCPKCYRAMRVPDDAAGKTGQCKTCGQAIVVPGPGPDSKPVDAVIVRPADAPAVTLPSPQDVQQSQLMEAQLNEMRRLEYEMRMMRENDRRYGSPSQQSIPQQVYYPPPPPAPVIHITNVNSATATAYAKATQKGGCVSNGCGCILLLLFIAFVLSLIINAGAKP